MNRTGQSIDAVRALALRMLCLIGVFGFRYGSVMVAVPLGSSACFFMLRLVLSTVGVWV